ncbi:DUF937 domain-containing protein [Streptomyces kanamyceticus]|uniref:DUF937 domain-containing protein n=1 Tax=Streptomyces kanamyceticus TaxID=1967 RepID=A0A5J6GID3_STRKN|nr:DUF937 domain-containing protein [Streptomyces kanamyceticus]QEU94254.1 DUF937 domain-containing protein [Streptomyces kanamyceticus]
MSDSQSFEQDVLNELGDDKLQEIAGLLGTDAAGAQDVVGTTVSALSGDLQDKAAAADPAEADEVRQAFAEVESAEQPPASGEQPLQGVAAFGGLGGLAAGGMMSGVLARMSKPVANAVSKKTGIPAPTVSRVIEMLIPVVLAVLTKRAASTKADGAAPKASASSGGLGDLLGQILGGKK